MPELAEVELAAEVIRSEGKGKFIIKVETVDDTIEYEGTSHDEFAKETTGRKLLDTGRYGKVFYLMLEGEGRMPVLHLGMTGMLQVRGQEAVYYRKKPKQDKEVWPPKFMKFILHFASLPDGPTEAEIAFLDPRRLGRIRLAREPLNEPPISKLGFDPILCMPDLEEFSAKVLKRGCPIKALLLDQSFSAGVGNWIADEVLFHSEIHPEQVAKSLNSEQVKALHRNIVYVCKTAVDVKADHRKFPNHWLFPHRWGKGKSKGKDTEKSRFVLQSGEVATIKWITVGGRTSAVVQQVQKLDRMALVPNKPKKKKATKKKAKESDEESDLTEISEGEAGPDEREVEEAIVTRKVTKRKAEQVVEVEIVANKRSKHFMNLAD